MAQFRYVYTNFWEDPKVSECFTPEDKFCFLYLLTNAHTTQIGVYRITKKLMAFEMGYSIESINSLLDRFENHHKLIKYNSETRELAIKNWGKFNLKNGGKPIEDLVKKEFRFVEDKQLLLYVLDGVKNEKIRKLFIDELVKAGLVDAPEETKPQKKDSSPSSVDGTIDDTSYGTSTSRGQNENENENENKNINNIYIENEKSVKPVDNVDNSDLSDETSDDRKTVPYNEIIKAYHDICVSMPKVIKITSDRKRLMKAVWKENKDIKAFINLFTKAQKSDFLSGRDGKWTGCNFDWLLNNKKMLRVLEGVYDNKPSVPRANTQAAVKPSNFNNFTPREYDYDDLEKKLLGWES
ncbi:hypothetical protein N4T77_18995 [Clostridium sp. CX1]|uniref:hypothetical protein n=1 Tax=Clostridium sp. CX1 TaxID=2978346 RepID=UPI0021C23DC6|nr:hypothetical protein [Clostridium sp. CX1]MCT8978681.1 hypothetical protein [Clostridium sp. CX1]